MASHVSAPTFLGPRILPHPSGAGPQAPHFFWVWAFMLLIFHIFDLSFLVHFLILFLVIFGFFDFFTVSVFWYFRFHLKTFNFSSMFVNFLFFPSN